MRGGDGAEFLNRVSDVAIVVTGKDDTPCTECRPLDFTIKVRPRV